MRVTMGAAIARPISTSNAIMLNSRPPASQTIGTAIVRSAILTPMVTSIIVVSIIWAMMYQSSNGLFQSVLVAFGLSKMAFISDPRYALPAISVMMIWKDIGFSFIIFVADEFHESEKLSAIRVEGNRAIMTSEIFSLAKIDRSQKFYDIDLRSIEARILVHPVVRSVAIEREVDRKSVV